MSEFRPSPDLQMHFEVDDFTDPWRQPQTILMLHGNAESGLAWYAWVPKLARRLSRGASRHARLRPIDRRCRPTIPGPSTN